MAKLDKIEASLLELNITLVEQGKDLKYHIKRSDQADAAIKLLSDEMESGEERINTKIEPIQKHVTMVEGVMKFLALIALLAGIYQAFK
jgi:hypothetical protein